MATTTIKNDSHSHAPVTAECWRAEKRRLPRKSQSLVSIPAGIMAIVQRGAVKKLEPTMKRGVLAGLLVVVSVSMALSAPRARVNMPDELRTKISADVTKQTAVTPAVKWKRGRKIDDSAVLQDVPGDWGNDLAKYKYVYTEGRVWFGDPASRKAVDAIKVTR